MNISLSADLTKELQQEIEAGGFQNPTELIEQAVRQFLESRHRGQRRMAALKRIGQAVDQAGFYDSVLLPSHA
jgi:Arc/MetJ-type ribon-helix-helix transcriptional regulator